MGSTGLHTQTKKYFFIGTVILVAMMLLNSIHSIQYYNPDEHYQIIEFAAYKQGEVRKEQLAWEFEARSRQAIQPFIAYGIFNLADVLGLHSPNQKILLMRLGMIFLVVPVILFFLKNTLHFFSQELQVKYILGYLSIWILPYYFIRFTSETFSGILFLWVVAILIAPQRNKWLMLLGGFLTGIACYSRFQTLLPLIGLVMGFQLFHKPTLREYLYLVAGIMPAVGIGMLADFWLYEEWVFTPWNYVNYQVFKNVANDFGTAPFYYYLVELFKLSTPFMGLIIFIILVFTPMVKGVNMIYLVFVSALVTLSAFGHKEFRFLIPIIVFLPFMFFSLIQTLRSKQYFFSGLFQSKWMLVLILVANLVCFAYYTLYNNNWFTDNPKALTYVLARNYKQSNIHLLYANNDHPLKDDVVLAFKQDTLHLYQNFFKPKQFSDQKITQLDSNSFIKKPEADIQLFYIRKGVLLKMENVGLLENMGYKLKYISAPLWLEQILNSNPALGKQYNDWVFYLYELK